MDRPPRAPVDSAVLQRFRDRARSHPLVAETNAERTGGAITTLVLVLAADQYPDRIDEARLEIQWYENGEYNLHYYEDHERDDWQCRWDRHPNPHAEYAHFHRPPRADAGDAVDDPAAPDHPQEVLTRTLANVRDRIEDLWR
jgi:hypothetical protein